MSDNGKFVYTGSNSAPLGCPTRVLGGDFLGPGNAGAYIPASARIHKGWGFASSIYTDDDVPREVPDRFTIAYFSYIENKLYRGEFALPRDSIARLFAAGFASARARSGRGHYDELVAGMAPGGAVAVWLSGEGRQVEVFFGQAAVAHDDWHRATGFPPTVDRARMVTSVLDDAQEDDSLVREYRARLPLGLWAAYRTRYRWVPAAEGLPTPTRLSTVQYFNGERDAAVPVPFAHPTVAAGLPIPKFLTFADRAAGLSYQTTFDFDETAAALARAGVALGPPEAARTAPVGTPAELVFSRTPDGSAAELRVRRGAEVIPLRKAVVAVYRLRR